MVQLVPLMTSNTSPSGRAFSIGHDGNTNYLPYKAFDGDLTTSWMQSFSTHTSGKGNIGYEFESSQIIGKYKISYAQSNVNQAPKNWTFEGSNSSDDSNDWVVLHSVTNQTWSVGETKEFSIDNSMSYKKYRLNITATGDMTYVRISEFQLYKGYFNKFLILSNDGTYSIQGKSGYESVIPKMTSNTSPSGKVSSTNVFSTTYDSWKAFDGDSTSRWATLSGTTTGWLRYDFQEKVLIDKYIIKIYNNWGQHAPNTWSLEGSNDDGDTWEVLDNRSNYTLSMWNTTLMFEFEVQNPNSYKSYRINTSLNNGGVQLSIAEMELYKNNTKELIILSNTDETNIINHGMDKSTEIDLNSELKNKVFVEQSPTTLGSGKVFSKTIDTSKTPIKKVTIK